MKKLFSWNVKTRVELEGKTKVLFEKHSWKLCLKAFALYGFLGLKSCWNRKSVSLVRWAFCGFLWPQHLKFVLTFATDDYDHYILIAEFSTPHCFEAPVFPHPLVSLCRFLLGVLLLNFNKIDDRSRNAW